MALNSQFLKFKEIYSFLNCDVFSRCSSEGENVLNARHIIAFGKVNSTDAKVVKTLALCLKTSELSDTPHEIQGTFRIDEPELQISEMKCSCTAGESQRCKHIAAFLLLCTRTSIFDFEEFSCTDIKCYWKSNKEAALEQYNAKPFERWSCVNRKRGRNEDSRHGFVSDHFPELTKKINHGAFALHNRARHEEIATTEVATPGASVQVQVPQELLEIANNALISAFMISLDIDVSKFNLKTCCQNVLGNLVNANVISIAIKTKEQIERWRCERQYRLTGSRCYAIFTYSKDNWEQKTRNYFWPKPFTNKYIRHGIEHENEALISYKTKNGHNTYEPGLIVCQKYPWLAYTPDAIVLDGDGKPKKLVEIKCPYIGTTHPAVTFGNSCKFLKLTPTGLILKQKHQYYGQVQLGMAILNLKETDFIVYSTSSQSFINIVVPFDEVFTRQMIRKITDNYFYKMIHVVCEKENTETL